MADSKLPQKLIRENPFKRLITRLVLLAFLNQNLAFATHSIIELDFKDSQASQRLHVIPRLSNVGDVSHIEIDTEQKQVAVYLKEKQEEALDEVEKNSSQGADVPVITKPVILQKHDIINLPWELEPEKLTLFILNHTAWLSPLSEDGYKLEFKGGLLGGMKQSGGNQKNIYQCSKAPKTDNSCWVKGGNFYAPDSSWIGKNPGNISIISNPNYSQTGGSSGSKGTSSGGSGWQSVLGKGWDKIKENGDKARDRMQQQQENLKKLNTANQPFEIYKRKDIVIPDNPFPRIQPPQPVRPIPQSWEGKIGMIDESITRLSWNEMYYLARKLGIPDQVITDWRNYRASHDEVSLVSYLETKRKIDIEKAKKVLQQKINSGEYLKEKIISSIHPSQAKGITIGKNQNGAVGVHVPFISLTYPVSESERAKKGAFLPTGYVITPHAEYLVNETGKILTKGNGIPSTENAVSIAYLVTGLLQEVLEDTARSSQSIYTKDGFEKRLKEATRLHHNLSGITFSKKPGEMDSEKFMTTFLLPLVQNMAYSLGGSSKSLVLSNYSGLMQSLNKNNQVSIYSAFTNLHYPIFTEDRGKEGSLLPATYKPTKESEYLIGYTRGYVDANKIKHHVEELQSIGYLVHEAMAQAVEDCRSGDEWDKGEFYTCLKAMTLHHLQMSGAEWVNTKMSGYFTEQLLPRIIYQAAFHHERIPKNKKPFQDTVLNEWTKTNWMDVVDDEAEVIQVKGGIPPFMYDLMKQGIQKGGGLLKQGWQKAVQAYKIRKIEKLFNNKNFKQDHNIPENWQQLLADKQNGIKYQAPKNPRFNEVRFMKGNPKSDFPAQRVDYVKIKKDGHYRDKLGSVVREQDEAAHIPLPEFNFNIGEFFK